MKVTPDTNVLVRAAVQDDLKQARAASKLLKEAELLAISSSSLCEFVWVLRRIYKFEVEDIASALETLIDAENVQVNRPAVEDGMKVLRAGGDFADGIIAHEGNWLGGETFVTFDKKAFAILSSQGYETRLLS